MSHPSLVTLHSMVHSFIEFCKPHHYDKAVIHEGSLFNMHLHFSTTVRNLQFIYLFKPKIHIKQFDNMCVKHISQLDYNVYLQFFLCPNPQIVQSKCCFPELLSVGSLFIVCIPSWLISLDPPSSIQILSLTVPSLLLSLLKIFFSSLSLCFEFLVFLFKSFL